MDFDLSPERQMLVETISRYVRERYAPAERNAIAWSDTGWSPDHWRQFAELGVIGALFTEAEGGFAGGGHDLEAVFHALGAGLVVEPLLGTLMAGRALAECGETEALERIIDGSAIILFAHEEAGGGEVATRATRGSNGWTLNGAKAVIPQLSSASEILVSAMAPAGLSLFLVDRDAPGVSIRDYQMIDGGHGGDLRLDGAAARLVGTEGAASGPIEAATAAGLLALGAEAVGIMDALRDQTLEYLRTRKQFGVPIGSFQALKHRMANLALEIEQARSAVTNAAAALSEPWSARELAASAAKFTIGRVGTLAAEEAIQLHGGIGMTWELPLSHFAKRLIMIGHQLGDEDYHLDRYIQLRRTANG